MTDRGWIMPEEAIEPVLQDLLADIASAYLDDSIDTLLRRIFWNVPDARLAQIKDWLARADINIIFGYPTEQTRLPCWCLLAGHGNNNVQFLGDDEDEVEIDGVTYPTKAEIWGGSVGIVAHAENADQARYMVQLALWGLSRGRMELGEVFKDGQKAQYSDMEPTRTDSGRLIFRRAAVVNVTFFQRDIAFEESTNITNNISVSVASAPHDVDYQEENA